eukprot:s628_g1.t1
MIPSIDLHSARCLNGGAMVAAITTEVAALTEDSTAAPDTPASSDVSAPSAGNGAARRTSASSGRMSRVKELHPTALVRKEECKDLHEKEGARSWVERASGTTQSPGNSAGCPPCDRGLCLRPRSAEREQPRDERRTERSFWNSALSTSARSLRSGPGRASGQPKSRSKSKQTRPQSQQQPIHRCSGAHQPGDAAEGTRALGTEGRVGSSDLGRHAVTDAAAAHAG